MESRTPDVICMGRAAVDLYAEQVGAPLEDVTSFAKYLGGSPANIAVGTSRLGLASAMFTKVGDEPLGRFVKKALEGYGVDTRAVTSDPAHLTGLVILGIQPPEKFPILFYREQCADIHLSVADVDPAFIASAKALVVSGTGVSRQPSRDATHQAIRVAREAGRRVVMDIDWRPTLWLADPVAAQVELGKVVAQASLVVGTEEEAEVAGGVEYLRRTCPGTVVVKRGPRGCTVFAKGEPGVDVSGFKIEVLNVLGAGDGFLSGFLRGWLHDWPLQRCAKLANAVGAIVVTKHGCAPAMPTFAEVEAFFRHHGAGAP